MLHAKSMLCYHYYSFCCLTVRRQYWQTKFKQFQGCHWFANNGSLSQANRPKMQERKYIYNCDPLAVKNEPVTLFEIYTEII